MEVRKRFENDKLKKLQIFNGAQLKYIAFISMLIDHVNNALITPFLNGKGFLLHLSNLFSILGRIAFPIFVFFIVEGFFKTSNPPFASSAKGLCHCRQAGAGRQPRCHYLSPVVDVSSRLRGGKPSRCGSPPAPACCRQTRSTRYCLLPQLLLSYPSSYFLLSSSANRIISAPLSSTAVTAWLNASPSGSTSP